MATISNDTQAIIDSLINEGKLTRNDMRTNSIRSVNVRLDKFGDVFNSIDLGIGKLNEKVGQMVGKAILDDSNKQSDIAAAFGLDEEYVKLQTEAAQLQISNSKDEALLNKAELAEKVIAQKQAEDDRKAKTKEDSKMFKGGLFNAAKNNKMSILKYGLLGYAGFQIIRGALDQFTDGKFSEILSSAGTAIKEFVETIDWKAIGANLSKFGTILSEAPWTKIGIGLAAIAALGVGAILPNLIGAGIGGALAKMGMAKVATTGLPAAAGGMAKGMKLGPIGASLLFMAVTAALPMVKDAIKKSVFGMTEQDIKNAKADPKFFSSSTGLDILGNAAQGASIGLMFGPKGALVGAIAGIVIGTGAAALGAIKRMSDESGSQEVISSQADLDKISETIRLREDARAALVGELGKDELATALDNDYGSMNELLAAKANAEAALAIDLEANADKNEAKIKELQNQKLVMTRMVSMGQYGGFREEDLTTEQLAANAETKRKKIEALKAEAIAIRTRLEGQNVDASLIEAVVADRLKKTMEPGMFAKLFGEKDPTMEQVKELPQFKAMLVDMLADSSFTASGSTVINQYVGGAVSGDTIVDSSKKETYSNYLTNFNGADGASGNLSVQGS
jgi:hypothetical protein